MATRVHFRWNEAEFQRVLGVQTVPEAVWRAAGRTRDRAKVNLTTAGRIGTGALRNSIVARRLRGGSRPGVWQEIGSGLKYAIWQHDGTDGPIYPRRATLLRFKPSGSSTFVFAKQVRGVTGTPYLTDALRSLSVSDFKV